MSANTLIIQQQLPFPIKSSLVLNMITIVLIDDGKTHAKGDKTLDRNVYAFNADGTLKWQIHEVPGGGDYPKPFTSLKLEGRDKIIAYNWIGTDYQVDLEDGSLHFQGSARRPW